MTTTLTPATVVHQGSEYFIENYTAQYTLRFDDGETIAIEGRWLVLNASVWISLVKRQLPVTRQYLIHHVFVTKAEIARVHTAVLNAVISSTPIDQQQDVLRNLKMELAQQQYDLDILISSKMARWHLSFTGFDIARVMTHPRFKEVAQLNLEEVAPLGIEAVEQRINTKRAEIKGLLLDPTFRPNVLFGPLVLKAVDERQLLQLVGAGGTRTDVNDQLIETPIASSYMRGFSSAVEYALDSRAAAKAIFLNARAMAAAQYANRKEQLHGSVLRRIHPGDCGSDVYITYEVNKRNHMRFEGKLMVDDNGTHKPLLAADLPNYIGKQIRGRSPLTCRHTDGFCRACMGLIWAQLPESVVPGKVAVHETQATVSQMIVGSKHLSSTSAIPYRLSETFEMAFTVSRSSILFQDHVKLKGLLVGVPYQQGKKLPDLQYVNNMNAVNEQYFSSISTLALGRVRGTEEVWPPGSENTMGNVELDVQPSPFVDMITGKTQPYFSSAFLEYVFDHPHRVHMGKYIWVDMTEWNVKKPVFRFTVANDSAVRFNMMVNHFTRSSVSTYKSANRALADYSSLMYSMPSITPNIVYLEIILRASMITSLSDFRLPVVTDPDNVLFTTLSNAIPRRSLGTLLAFERQGTALSNPVTFITPRIPGLYDNFIGI